MLEKEVIEKFDSKNIFINDFKMAYNKMKNKKECKELAFLCVGTDRVIGDCFGPLVGSKLLELLEKENISNINVLGSLEKNINYNNIENIIEKVNDKTGLIVIDAALSKKENIGKIFVANKSTVLGKGLNKNKIDIGDISIKSVVAKDYKIPGYNFKSLQNTSLNDVIKSSNIVAEGIYDVIKNY